MKKHVFVKYFCISLLGVFFFSSATNAKTYFDYTTRNDAQSNLSVSSATSAYLYIDTQSIGKISTSTLIVYSSVAVTLTAVPYDYYGGSIIGSSSSFSITTTGTNTLATLVFSNLDTNNYDSILLKFNTNSGTASNIRIWSNYLSSLSPNRLLNMTMSGGNDGNFTSYSPFLKIEGTDKTNFSCTDVGCIDPDACETCEDCNSIGEACTDFYSDDLSLVTGCEEEYASGTDDLLSVKYKFFHLPIITFLLIVGLLSIFFFRFLKEFLIRLRQ